MPAAACPGTQPWRPHPPLTHWSSTHQPLGEPCGWGSSDSGQITTATALRPGNELPAGPRLLTALSEDGRAGATLGLDSKKGSTERSSSLPASHSQWGAELGPGLRVPSFVFPLLLVGAPASQDPVGTAQNSGQGCAQEGPGPQVQGWTDWQAQGSEQEPAAGPSTCPLTGEAEGPVQAASRGYSPSVDSMGTGRAGERADAGG